MTAIQLVAGLGNPGAKYEQTRHNAGFWFVDELARCYSTQFRPESKYRSDVARCTIDGSDCRLQKPMEFMNRSGQSVAALARYYKIAPEEILVIHDELDLPPGVNRIKQSGGHGGHNGLRSLIDVFGSPDFPRIKLGVRGASRDDCELADYVLAPFEPEEHDLVERLVERGAHAVRGVLEVGVRAAMNLHNRPDPEVGDESEVQTEPE